MKPQESFPAKGQSSLLSLPILQNFEKCLYHRPLITADCDTAVDSEENVFTHNQDETESDIEQSVIVKSNSHKEVKTFVSNRT